MRVCQFRHFRTKRGERRSGNTNYTLTRRASNVGTRDAIDVPMTSKPLPFKPRTEKQTPPADLVGSVPDHRPHVDVTPDPPPPLDEVPVPPLTDPDEPKGG